MTRSWISSGAGRRRPRSAAGRFIEWLDITASKFYDWRERYGIVDEHNGWVPRDSWLEDWEKQAIVVFHLKYPLEGYRRQQEIHAERDRKLEEARKQRQIAPPAAA